VKLVDTSAWIHGLRPDGDPAVAARVYALLASGDAAWCPLIRLELWNGARGQHEQSVLRDMERDLPELEISQDVWALANGMARGARRQGKTVPANDILIAACARHHGAELEHADSHFEMLIAIP
jgi:predicted nucleic acid-binding protein